jgi:hypothetical protein
MDLIPVSYLHTSCCLAAEMSSKQRGAPIETTASSLRQHCTKRYADVVREERHFCAVLFHALMRCEDNLKKFLFQCGVKDAFTRDLSDAAVYVEYAYARNLPTSRRSRPTPPLEGRGRIKRDSIQAHCTPPVPLPDPSLRRASLRAMKQSGIQQDLHLQRP